MDIKKTYKKYKEETSGMAIKKAMEEINSYIDNMELNEKFYKEYADVKNLIFLMDVIAPSLIYGIVTGITVSAIDAFETLIGKLFILIVGLIITIAAAWPYVHSPVRRTLYPYLLKRMEEKLKF